MTPLSKANTNVLNQLKRLISLCVEETYLPCEYEETAGIGQHIRHILDHYRAFKRGFLTKQINYNIRTRNSAEETSRDIALDFINELINWFETTKIDQVDISIVSEIDVYTTHSETLPSNINRELLYLINHSIHHMAFVTLLAKNKGIAIPHDIGLAPGTASYERSSKDIKSSA